MCDQDQLIEMGKSGLSRREFGAMGAMAALAACASVEAEAQEGGLTETNVTFAAPGGTMDAVFIHPASGKHPAVILWPDIAGIREAKKIMARRLAAARCCALVRRWSLDLVDDDDLHRTASRFELETKLLLQGGEERRMFQVISHS